jgi:hypothetical protein
MNARACLVIVSVACVATAACKNGGTDGSGGSGSSSTSTAANGTGGAFNPPDGSFEMHLGPIAVPAGTEKTQCVTKRLGNMGPIHVGTIHNDLIGVSHHMIVYKVNDTVEQPDPVNCQPFTDALDPAKGSPIMITQKSSETLTLPKGVAFNLDANQMIRLEMHYVNPTAADASVEGVATFVPMPDAEFQNEAGFLFAGSVDIDIAPMSKASVDQFIKMPPDLTGKNYFGFTGHQHHFGTGVTVDMGTKGAATKPVYDVGAAFTWSEPPTEYHDPPVVLEANGGFQIKCDWDNTGPNQIKFGESAEDEMCFFWGYYYPNAGSRVCFHTDKLGGVDSCCPGGQFCDQFQ